MGVAMKSFLNDFSIGEKIAEYKVFANQYKTVFRYGILIGLVFMVLSIPVGMYVASNVDDDTAFSGTSQPKQSKAVATAVALIDREVNQHYWVANDPWFYPSAWVDNTAAFQMGIMASLARFGVEMTDNIGRVRGSSIADKDLEKASGLLKYSGKIWRFDFSTSLLPTATSEEQYRSAKNLMERYNTLLMEDVVTFEKRSDNLQMTLRRFASDMGSESAVLEKAQGDLMTWDADDVFYYNKGKMYAYYLILRDLGADFADVLADKELSPAWDDMLLSLKTAAELNPMIIFNGGGDNTFLPSHLGNQGFALLRARTKIKEIENILEK